MSTDLPDGESIAQLHADNRAVEEAMREVAREVVLLHKRAGQPLVSWKDGAVVLIPPENVTISETGEITVSWPEP